MSTDEYTDEQYTEQVQALYESTYQAKMQAKLVEIAEHLRYRGYEVTEPFDLSGDDFQWAITAKSDDLPEDVSITVEIAESLAYGGGLEGINFGLDIVAYGGRILGGLTPYNFTDDVWVPLSDPDAIADRWQIIEDAHAEGVYFVLDEYAGESENSLDNRSET